MTDPEAVVVDVSAGTARVTVRREACPRCQSGRGCGAGLLAGTPEDINLTVPVAGGLRLTRGDRVALSLAPGLLARGVLAVYGLPLSGLVIAAAAATWRRQAWLGPVCLLECLPAGRWRGVTTACRPCDRPLRSACPARITVSGRERAAGSHRVQPTGLSSL